MYTGPKLQNDLADIVLRWRKHRYVFTADIEKMYRQIKIHPDDQNYLRVLWRASTREPVQEYQLTTVTYGTAAAPFLAIRTLHQLAQDEKVRHPHASHVLSTDFYVDDLLTGADSLREAKALQKELISLLASGGFKLRKWTTNQQCLIQDIPEDFREKNLITSKTKVAPIRKQTTLPRLELCAALLLTKLVARTKSALNVKIDNIYAWTDSKIALAWIQGETKKWESFVANRVTEIRMTIKSSAWHYVKSEHNPADCASRGISPTQLRTHPLWWTGPHWLASPKEDWPTDLSIHNDTSKNLTTGCTATSSKPITNNDIFTRFSNFRKMIRILTHCRRFIYAVRHHPERKTGKIQADELHQTLSHCIKILQKRSFPDEVKAISKGTPIPRSSKLLCLTPFIDNEGLLRLGGRLDHSQLPFNQKHPIILPHGDHFTTLIIQDAHITTLHGGNQAPLAYLRQKYWIIDAKSAIKAIIHRCITCCRYRGASATQLMGNLPAARVVPSKPFTNTEIDYAGPFYIRVSKGRGTKSYKGYMVVFVCLSTKALHLEAVSDLTTEAFLAAYKRFTARRGHCSNIYSDNGTTFIGAKNEIDRQFFKTVRQSHEEASEQLTNYGTKWHFIPPSSPHFGGLWEAGVKSTKYHFKRIAGDVNWTFEEFSTLLAQIEACLNSRPLCPLTNDPEDLAVLTPGHFLIGRPLLTPPESSPPEESFPCRTRWKLINKLQNDFWKMWSSEYLSRLQQRTKWHTKSENIKDGDVVLLKEDNLPPGRWLLGRIENTHPGADGLVRVATVKTQKNTLKLPISKICKLPFQEENFPVSNPSTQTNEQSSHITVATITSQEPKRKHAGSVKIHATNIPTRPPIEELQRTSLSTRPHKRVKISSLLLLLNCILSTFAQSTPPTNSPDKTTIAVEIKPLEHNPGIYMEHISHLYMVNNRWNIVVYYDLNTYYQQLNGFEECMVKLANLCNQITTYNYYCNSILTEYRHKLKEMHHNNLILHRRNGNHLKRERQRRAPLEIIGTLQHTLFGLLDQNYADYIEEEIGKLRENENYLLSLAKNQTSVAEATTNVLKKTTEEIQQQFEVFNNHITTNLEALRLGAQKSEIIQTFTALAAYTSFIMNNYEKVQKELIELVLDAHNGKISPFLLTPQQLQAQIKHIREHIPTSLIIPGETNSEDLLTLYKIITVKSRVLDSMIIFKMQMPLPDAKLFQLFKIFPIPTEHNNEYFYIEPSSEFLASSLHRDIYYPLTQTELAGCIKTDILGYLCQQKHPVYTIQSPISRCEMDLLNHKRPSLSACHVKKTHPSQYWIQLQHPNHWIFVMNEETTINIVCGSQVIIKKLRKSGIIRLDNNCQVKHPTMSINAQNILSNTQRSSFLPLTNLSALLAETQPNNKVEDHPIPLIHLDTKPLDNIHFSSVKKDLLPVNHHHVHHYTIIYILTAIIIIAIVWYKCPQLFRCRTTRTRTTNDTTFEVQNITPRPAKRTTTTSTRAGAV